MMKNYLLTLSIALFISMLGINKTQAQIMYGVTPQGGANQSGILFKYTATGSIQKLVDFGNSDNWKFGNAPSAPEGNFVRGSNGLLYGITKWGGVFGEGTVYSYEPIGDSIHILANFDYNSGSPERGLVLTTSGILYGSTEFGGTYYNGLLFSVNPANDSLKLFHSLNYSNGYGIKSGFTLHSDGMLYGAATYGATYNHGAIVKIDPSNDNVSYHFTFDSLSGYNVQGKLYSYNGKLYGLAMNGGADMRGTIFEYNPVNDALTVLYFFTSAKSSTGNYPSGGLNMVNGKLYGTTTKGGANNHGVIFSYDLATGTYNTEKELDSLTHGKSPSGTLALGNDGWLYGSCNDGGAFNNGTFFKYHPVTGSFVKLFDFNGIDGSHPTVGTAIETTELAFTASDTVLTSPPFNIQFTNNTPNPSKYIWHWEFGDGTVSYQASPSHTYTNNGSYTVSLIAYDTVLQRQDTLMKQNYLTLSGGAGCPVGANIAPSGMIYICAGDSVKLSANNSNSSNSYQWLRTGIYINGANDSVYWAKQPGYYQVRVDDGNCWNFSNIAFVQQYPSSPPIIYHWGSFTPCSNDSLELQINNNLYGNLLWSTGDTTNSIYVKTSGYYTVSTVDNNNCKLTSPPHIVNAAMVNAPELCIVGVDSASGHNIIVWNQSNDLRIDSFKVYKEGMINNQFIFLASKSRTEPAVFIDQNSDPRVMAYRYRLMAVDSCGTETPVGHYHKTIHLQVNIGIGNTWNLHWNNYEGAQLGSYKIYRGTDSLQMQLLTVVPTSVHSYTDLNPPAGDVYYLLKVDLPMACNPGGGSTYNLSSSNFFNTKNATVGVEMIKMHDISLSVYPNPNNGRFTLKLESSIAKRMNIGIFNSLGSLVYSEQLNIVGTLNKTMDLRNLSKGVYFIRLQTIDDVVIRKVIIQ